MADVYTNDLRIREQEVGANSGAWGGYLNTTLENIAEAFSYGTEALADSATQTLTLADGASDELRSLYLKLTGTLSQATTVTIAPNTISKCWIIENATTGGYDVTISQGSGANVTVGNGNVKMIATDGAGAGGVVYDLFTDLELAGNVSITTTDNTSNLTLISTDADANIGPVLELYRNSGTPADNDELARIYFYGENDNDEKIEYALIKSKIVDASDGAEGSSLQIYTYSTGGQRNRIDLLEGETVFNEGSADVDFRVESDANANRLFVDAGQDQVLFGTTASRSMSGVTSSLFQEGTSYDLASLGLVANTNASNGAYLMLGTSRGTSNGSSTIVQDNDELGGIFWHGADGTDIATSAAFVAAYVDGTPGSNDMPGRLIFATTADGASSSTERMRIDNAGAITMPTQPAFSAQTSAALTNVATDGSNNTVKFGTEIFDQNANFNTTTFTFTAPVTGKYQLSANVYMNDSDADCTYLRMSIKTSNRDYVNIIEPEYDADRERDTMTISALADMDASDTAYVEVGQYEGTAQMDVPASANSRFTGFLAC